MGTYCLSGLLIRRGPHYSGRYKWLLGIVWGDSCGWHVWVASPYYHHNITNIPSSTLAKSPSTKNLMIILKKKVCELMGVINMSIIVFNTLVGMGSRSHDFDDELKIRFLILSCGARSETFILDLISFFLFCTLSVNLERIVTILYTKYLDKLSQRDFTDVNSGREGGGIPCRMLFIELHTRRRLSKFSEITSAKYFDSAFVIILLHRWCWCTYMSVFVQNRAKSRIILFT